MPCSKTWTRSSGAVWTVQATDDAASVFMTGHLSVLNWKKKTVATKVFTETELNEGIDVPIRSGNAYLMSIVAVPPGNGTVGVTGKFSVDGVAFKDVRCKVSADDPLCLWRMRRL